MNAIRKPLSLLLSLIMIVSVFTILPATEAAAAPAFDGEQDLAQETVQGGAILHCFDWSYNTIRENLYAIKNAGYTAVQTSPVQQPKDYNAWWTDTDGQWWKLYQPLGLRIAPDGTSWLGTKAELKALCDEAEEVYGIKVIVDIVANHLANNGSYGGGYSNLNQGVDNDMKNANYYHTDTAYTNDNSRYNITQRHLGQPDLNTGNRYVQQKVLSLLEECVDCGVDGFRFDAAKHIELRSDPSNCCSDFWQVVTDGIREYCEEKNLPEPFLYGEVLGSAGPGTDISEYTQYMAVTDSGSGNSVLNNIRNGNIAALANGSYIDGSGAKDCVLWAESHDTYIDGTTKNVSNEDIKLAWAVVGSRADSTSLFLARPGNTMGQAGDNDSWCSDEVCQVNRFKNLFDGQSEYLSVTDNVFMNERGTKGAVIVVKGGGKVRLNSHKLADGVYKDWISGDEYNFTVSNGVISGNVNLSGVAVLYNDGDTADTSEDNVLYLKPNAGSNSWAQGNERYAMYVYGSDGDAWASMTDADSDGIYSGTIPEGNWDHVIFCRMNGNTTENKWGNKWCQTGDLELSSSYNLYTIDDSVTQDTNPATGAWSVYGSAVAYNHTYGAPMWAWESDFSSATATFNCQCGCGDSVTLTDPAPATMQKNGVTCHTASVTFNGVAYSVSAVDDINGTLYLYPGESWSSNNARFAMYFYGPNGSAWAGMTPTSDAGYYQGDVPEGTWTNVIFCRMDPSTTTNSWNNKWTQTADLAPFDTNLLTLADDASTEGSASVTGAWGHYHPYGEPVWNWNDYDRAEATFTCPLCSDVKTVADNAPTSVITTSATVTTDGVRTYTASVQNPYGTIYTNTATEVIPALGAAITGHSLSLKDEIAINFFAGIDTSKYNGEITATYSYGTGDYAANRQNLKANVTTEQKGGNVYHKFACKINPRAMTDTVTLTVKCDGEPILTADYRVVDYCQDAAADYDDDEALKKLLCDMLNYGASVQTYFSYRTDDPASDYIEQVDEDWAADSAPASLPTPTTNNLSTLDSDIFGYSYAGAVMTATYATGIRLYFEKTDAQKAANTTVTVNGTAVTPKYDDTYGEYYRVDIKGISAKDIFEDNTVVFTNGNNTSGLIYNAGEYYNAIMNDPTEAATQDTLKKMYVYYLSAKAVLV